MKGSLGVYWMFGYAPSDLRWSYLGAVLATVAALSYGVTRNWVLSLFLLGLAFVIFRQRFALRRQMACSRAKVIRKLAKCQALMVGYSRRPNGSITFERVMTFDRLTQLSPEAARLEIRSALLSLQGNAPVDTGESIDDLLRSVHTFVETKRSPLQWTPKPAA